MSDQMSRYVPPKGFFDPDDLEVLETVLQNAWTMILNANLINLAKDEALRRALCLKLFSLIRSKPTESRLLLEALLETLREDPSPKTAHGDAGVRP